MPPTSKTLRPDQVAEVETLAAVLNAQQMADYFGMARRTFYDLMARDEDVAARYKRGKARAVGSVAQNLIAKARAGNVTAMIFYLKTQGGWRETQEVEHSVVDRITRIIIDPATPADAQLEAGRDMRRLMDDVPEVEIEALDPNAPAPVDIHMTLRDLDL